MELEEAVKNLNNYIFAIDNFGTIDPKCCNNLYEPVKVVLKELDKKDKEIERRTEHAKYFSKERNKKIVIIGSLKNKIIKIATKLDKETDWLFEEEGSWAYCKPFRDIAKKLRKIGR